VGIYFNNQIWEFIFKEKGLFEIFKNKTLQKLPTVWYIISFNFESNLNYSSLPTPHHCKRHKTCYTHSEGNSF